jgi:hypothetical protein
MKGVNMNNTIPMLAKSKRYGRCSCKGHGCNCIVAEEVQSREFKRSTEKRLVKNEIEREISEL